MLIRSMAPQIIACDEIGSKEDILAIKYALNSGVKVLFTMHGKNIEDVKNNKDVYEVRTKPGRLPGLFRALKGYFSSAAVSSRLSKAYCRHCIITALSERLFLYASCSKRSLISTGMRKVFVIVSLPGLSLNTVYSSFAAQCAVPIFCTIDERKFAPCLQ